MTYKTKNGKRFLPVNKEGQDAIYQMFKKYSLTFDELLEIQKLGQDVKIDFGGKIRPLKSDRF